MCWPPVLADAVYDALRQLLTIGGIEPGSRIKIDVIAQQSVELPNPSSPRPAGSGLVVQEPHRGFMAAEILDERMVSEIYAVRSLPEPPPQETRPECGRRMTSIGCGTSS